MTTNNISRMCLVAREKKDIKDLFRIVKTPSGIILIQKDKKIEGRGAYISKNKELIEIAKKKHLLNKALRCQVDEAIYDELLAMC